jgi:DNA-binding NtrC family response regulator
MVIDDEPSVLESFKMILKIKDYEVETFPDGPSALQNLTKGKFDMAFIDYKLPVMDGLEVLRRIKEIDPEVEVVIVTAYATDASHANAITLGALEYLRKPFLMEEIYELVERGLKRRRTKGIKREPSVPPPSGIH